MIKAILIKQKKEFENLIDKPFVERLKMPEAKK